MPTFSSSGRSPSSTAARVSKEDRQARQQAMMSVINYFSELIADRRKTPREDLLSTALGWEIDGEPIPTRISSTAAS